MGVVLMSKRELNRIDILARLESGRLTPAAASELLQVSGRQVYRLMRRFREDGPAGLADRRRGHRRVVAGFHARGCVARFGKAQGDVAGCQPGRPWGKC